MVIKNDIQYRDFENQIELLIKRGTELGDMDLLSDDEKAKFIELSSALDEYGKRNYPLPKKDNLENNKIGRLTPPTFEIY